MKEEGGGAREEEEQANFFDVFSRCFGLVAGQNPGGERKKKQSFFSSLKPLFHVFLMLPNNIAVTEILRFCGLKTHRPAGGKRRGVKRGSKLHSYCCCEFFGRTPSREKERNLLRRTCYSCLAIRNQAKIRNGWLPRQLYCKKYLPTFRLPSPVNQFPC